MFFPSREISCFITWHRVHILCRTARHSEMPAIGQVTPDVACSTLVGTVVECLQEHPDTGAEHLARGSQASHQYQWLAGFLKLRSFLFTIGIAILAYAFVVQSKWNKTHKSPWARTDAWRVAPQLRALRLQGTDLSPQNQIMGSWAFSTSDMLVSHYGSYRVLQTGDTFIFL